ncbi:cell envelope-related function transcriptional attenuator common domain-containing protein [Sinosporangium album]|uniref:Cell envelope-related function transcriptional attenuator common domain-containing protein n=1 Tax=Sinosporangium album TaxID=504805 RepID=A0A1G8FT18_9ACTN|nr:LCP family protein [Sinosporangium album]SDH85283.1 cell envelope-related function transcriptional attenuator common domain-containing protein [Sinosporangium album]
MVRLLAGLLVLLLVASIVGYFWINGRLAANDKVLADYEGRRDDTAGTNWLLVGSDSRKGLSRADRNRLATGRAAGQRTDTMMLLHIPDDGRPVLVSLPRDSYVPIHNKGRNKLNAAYAFGGAPLLARTVEEVTGLRIDHYMEVGFAGFVDIVDAVGGVNICVKQPLKDPKAGINLKKGCQDMDGGTALGYVRTRVTGGLPDLDRAQRQRQFFAAVVKKASSPGTLINPFRMVPLATSATDAVVVDGGTSAFNLLSLGLAMGGNPITTSVPVTPANVPGVGSVLQWQRESALRMFNALAEGKPVPKDVLNSGG